MTLLTDLHADIEVRVQSIRGTRPEWLCGKGCANCCRRLAEIPPLSAAEWDLLQSGLAQLAPQHLAKIGQGIAALTEQKSRPLVCPLLDPLTNACPVYAQRPVACRTYGFYVQRDLGLYCHDIENLVADGALADVVWGNHNAIDQKLSKLGETRPLTEWFGRWQSGQ